MYPPNNKPHWGDGGYGIGFTTLKEHPRLSTLQLGLHTKRLSSVPDFQTLIKPMACGKFWHLPRNRAKASGPNARMRKDWDIDIPRVFAVTVSLGKHV